VFLFYIHAIGQCNCTCNLIEHNNNYLFYFVLTYFKVKIDFNLLFAGHSHRAV
jgi:hypothetical protein